jgi:hypothetical protein
MQAETIHLVQLQHPSRRHIALVRGPQLILIHRFFSVYDLALNAIRLDKPVGELINENLSTTTLNYDTVYNGHAEWRLLPSFDHPSNPLGCLVSGTGLTHKNSALNRQMMHQAGDKPTDSLQMYQWGLEQGSPAPGKIGVQPEWFYKGNGSVLKAHGEALTVPPYANDGGEEPEVAGLYIVDDGGNPYRVGFTTGNEFSDHVMEKKNYLYLAPSKLRECAIGPELVINGDFSGFNGKVSITRKDEVLWEATIKSGENHMAHNLANLEYHHFKYKQHRIPLLAHVHFFGADAFSFGNNMTLLANDVMTVHWETMGRPLRNNLRIAAEEENLIKINSIL